MNVRFLDTPSCVKKYYDRPETEFCLGLFGYHDFRVLTPSKTQRMQKFYTIHFIVSGKGRLEYHDKTYELGEGNIFLLPPNELFAYYPDDNEPWDYIFFEFDGSIVPTYLSEIGFSQTQAVKLCNNPRKVLSSFTEIFEKHKNGLPVSYFEAVAKIHLLLHSASDKHSLALAYPKADIVEEAKSLIALNFFNAEFTVETIAQQLHFSHSQLCRLFKEKTGVTMVSYLNDSRMKYAEELLRTTNLKATEISYMSSFNEYTYFLMQFKRRNHCTTSEYRNLNKNL